MAITFTQCAGEDETLLEEAMKKWHPTLVAAGVTIGILFKRKYDKDGVALPCVKVHGVPALAYVKSSSLEKRVHGLPDAKIVIDGSQWELLSRKSQLAVLDHELTHLAVKDEGAPDDHGRPKLKLKPHDWQIWGFAKIAERHGEFAPEVQAANQFRQAFGQLFLWPADSPMKKKAPEGENGTGDAIRTA